MFLSELPQRKYETTFERNERVMLGSWEMGWSILEHVRGKHVTALQFVDYGQSRCNQLEWAYSFFLFFLFFFSCFTVRCVIMLVSQKCRKIPTSFAVKRVDFVRYSYSVKFTLYPDCQLGYLYMIFYKGV